VTTNRFLPFAAVGGGAMLWGAWWIPLRALEAKGLPADWATFATSACALALLLPFALVKRHQLRANARPLLGMALAAGASFAAFNHAVVYGEIVRVTLLFYLVPVWASILGTIFLGERLGAFRILSILLGVAGAAIVLGYGQGFPMPRTFPEWLGLVSGLLWAISLTLFRRATEIPAVDKSIANFFGSALMGLVFALVVSQAATPATGFDPPGVAVLLALSAVWLTPMVVVELWGASRLDPGRSAVLLLLEVAVAGISATLLAGEGFGWGEAIGAVLIVSAGLVELRDHAREPA
jgi:drug/metabolite transporter (DMT)-like permease